MVNLGKPPAQTVGVTPSKSEVDSFRRDGFLLVERITTDAELVWLRGAFDLVVAEAAAANDGRVPDGGASGFQQYAFPEIRFPRLLETTFCKNARRYAAALLEVDENRLAAWGQFLWKRARDGKETPWHQDEAYWDPERAYRAVAAWLPLHDVDEKRSCLHFIPGSHRQTEVLAHEREATVGQLQAEDVDRDAAVACPLSAGGATFHHHRTLHAAGPNLADEPRISFALEFQVPPSKREVPARHAWFDQHRAVGVRGVYVADGKVIPFPE